jgi:hypothetical protein
MGSDPNTAPATVLGGDPPLNPSRPVPPPRTGSPLLDLIAKVSIALTQLERRFDPFFRPAFDALLRAPLTELVTFWINLARRNEGLALAEERRLSNEDELVDSIITSFTAQIRDLWKPGSAERGGNTKTFGIVRAEFEVHDNLPPELRHGIYARPDTYRAWVRFSGPGPYITPDIDDVGFMSISVKLMGVQGEKLMPDEKHTLDLTAVCTPTFVTADLIANANLQRESLRNSQILHFLNLQNNHVLDLLMQALWTRTQTSPLEVAYFSCVPYLLGPGQAMQFSFWPKDGRRTPIPRLPLRPPDDYLRQAMARTLAENGAAFDVRLQLQRDAHRMPIENNAVYWSERLSPRVSVATLRIPSQTFDSPSQLAFARQLSFNPWHTIADHRPLGNQSRGRKRMYAELLGVRQRMNRTNPIEPTGDEVFT